MCLHSNANSTEIVLVRKTVQLSVCSTNYMFLNDKVVYVVHIYIYVYCLKKHGNRDRIQCHLNKKSVIYRS